MTASIVIADESPALRQGIRSWLEDAPDFQVVSEAKDGSETVRLVKRLRPDVLVIDVRLPGVSGLDVLELARQYSLRTRGVVFTNLQQEQYLVEALQKGALAYVLKSSPAEVLMRALRSAAKGVYFLDAPFSERPVENYLKKAKARSKDPLESLSARQKEVLHLVAQGYSSTEIARRLYLSPRTVEQHRANLMRKLLLGSQTELICFALRRGIISLDE